MAKLHIHRRELSKADLKAVRDLVIQAGTDSPEIDVIEGIAEPVDGSDEEIILFLLSPEATSDPELEKTLLSAIDGGRRVIGIWPKDAPSSAPPAAVIKYCYSVVPWDADRINAVVGDDDFVCFESPVGRPLELPEAERRECP